MTIVTLLTDFGTADSYVAEMKGVLLTYAPKATLVDITHQVSPGDVRAAQYILSRTWMFFPEGTIYVAVVDAGVGTDRRVLGAARFGRYFLAPDNGLLSFLSLNAKFISIPVLPEAAPTFHGRDVFAPAAAVLSTGGSLESLGTAIADPHYSPFALRRSLRDADLEHFPKRPEARSAHWCCGGRRRPIAPHVRGRRIGSAGGVHGFWGYRRNSGARRECGPAVGAWCRGRG